MNKSDIVATPAQIKPEEVWVSALTGEGIHELKERIARLSVTDQPKLQIVGDLIHPGDFVLLVTPIDKAAPKGRLILPQQQTIRDILEADAAAIVVKEFELKETLESLGKKPSLVITDSQVFAKVSADTPPSIPLTSFSILMARYKGLLETAVKGVSAVEQAEGRRPGSHCRRVYPPSPVRRHRQCENSPVAPWVYRSRTGD